MYKSIYGLWEVVEGFLRQFFFERYVALSIYGFYFSHRVHVHLYLCRHSLRFIRVGVFVTLDVFISIIYVLEFISILLRSYKMLWHWGVDGPATISSPTYP